MKALTIFSTAVIITSILINTHCSNSSKMNSSKKTYQGAMVTTSYKSIPSCNSDHVGQVYYIKNKKHFTYCSIKGFQKIKTNITWLGLYNEKPYDCTKDKTEKSYYDTFKEKLMICKNAQWTAISNPVKQYTITASIEGLTDNDSLKIKLDDESLIAHKNGSYTFLQKKKNNKEVRITVDEFPKRKICYLENTKINHLIKLKNLKLLYHGAIDNEDLHVKISCTANKPIITAGQNDKEGKVSFSLNGTLLSQMKNLPKIALNVYDKNEGIMAKLYTRFTSSLVASGTMKDIKVTKNRGWQVTGDVKKLKPGTYSAIVLLDMNADGFFKHSIDKGMEFNFKVSGDTHINIILTDNELKTLVGGNFIAKPIKNVPFRAAFYCAYVKPHAPFDFSHRFSAKHLLGGAWDFDGIKNGNAKTNFVASVIPGTYDLHCFIDANQSGKKDVGDYYLFQANYSPENSLFDITSDIVKIN